MKRFLVGLALALVAGAASAISLIPPTEAVRLVAIEGDGMCSAVVVTENVALTARHCLRKGITVGGHAVKTVLTSGPTTGPDIAMLYVPGLECPCAKIGELPAEGDKLVSVGYPSGDEVVKVTEAVEVIGVDAPSKYAPWLAIFAGNEYENKYVMVMAAVLENGMSGGGAFVVQNDEWVLVGLNAIGFPRERGGVNEDYNGFVPITDIDFLIAR